MAQSTLNYKTQKEIKKKKLKSYIKYNYPYKYKKTQFLNIFKLVTKCT